MLQMKSQKKKNKQLVRKALIDMIDSQTLAENNVINLNTAGGEEPDN